MSVWMITIPLFIAAIGAGLMAGVYFAFSGFVMRSLDQLGTTQATDAMNTINKVILHSSFMLVFFGSTLLYAVLAVVAALDTSLAGRGLLIITGLMYVAGMFLCTVFFNVPLNNRLAAAGKNETGKAETWSHYLKHWTRWNHLRSVCSLATLALSICYLMWHT